MAHASSHSDFKSKFCQKIVQVPWCLLLTLACKNYAVNAMLKVMSSLYKTFAEQVALTTIFLLSLLRGLYNFDTGNANHWFCFVALIGGLVTIACYTVEEKITTLSSNYSKIASKNCLEAPKTQIFLQNRKNCDTRLTRRPRNMPPSSLPAFPPMRKSPSWKRRSKLFRFATQICKMIDFFT